MRAAAAVADPGPAHARRRARPTHGAGDCPTQELAPMKCADCGQMLEVSCPSKCEGQLDALDRGPGWHGPRPPRREEDPKPTGLRRRHHGTREKVLEQLRKAGAPVRVSEVAIAVGEDTPAGRGRVGAMLALMERDGSVIAYRIAGRRTGVRFSLPPRTKASA